jgi:hypothetical protein
LRHEAQRACPQAVVAHLVSFRGTQRGRHHSIEIVHAGGAIAGSHRTGPRIYRLNH